jgi:hypothetical protein
MQDNRANQTRRRVTFERLLVPTSAVSVAPTNYNICEGHKVPMNPHMSINAYVWTRTLSHSAIAACRLAHDCDAARGAICVPPL